MKTFVYKTAGGCDMHADVYPADGAGPAPVIVYIHGGALINGTRKWVNARQLAAFHEAGFTYVSIDYRLAPETKLPETIEDVRDAWRWVHEEGPGLFGVDASRAAVLGKSAGGYLSFMVAGFEPRPKAVVSFYGYGDIVAPWYTRPDPYYCSQPTVSKEEAWAKIGARPVSEAGDRRDAFYLYCRQQGIWPREVSGHDPEREPDFFRPYCPERNVTPDYPPMILLHGDMDTDVPYEQSVRMARALEAAGVEHELVTLAGRDHVFDAEMDDPEVAEAFGKALAFLKRHLTA